MKKWFTMLLCLILACAAFAAPAEEIPFATVGDAATDGAYYYYAPDYYVILVKKDGAWWRVDAQVDDRYGELYAGMYEAEDPVAADAELTAYARTLPVASAEKFSEQESPFGESVRYAQRPGPLPPSHPSLCRFQPHHDRPSSGGSS